MNVEQDRALRSSNSDIEELAVLSGSRWICIIYWFLLALFEFVPQEAGKKLPTDLYVLF